MIIAGDLIGFRVLQFDFERNLLLISRPTNGRCISISTNIQYSRANENEWLIFEHCSGWRAALSYQCHHLRNYAYQFHVSMKFNIQMRTSKAISWSNINSISICTMHTVSDTQQHETAQCTLRPALPNDLLSFDRMFSGCNDCPLKTRRMRPFQTTKR